jgi:hypothetical protein
MRDVISRSITTGDLSGVTGYSRHRLRALLSVLPGYGGKAEGARIARKYSRQDLAVIAVCCELESRYGLHRDAIGRLVSDVRRALSGPKTLATADTRLIVTLNPLSVRYVDGPSEVTAGLVVPLQAILRRIDGHLTIGASAQKELDLKPTTVRTSKRNESRKRRTVTVRVARK